jgi:hypothetical protein
MYLCVDDIDFVLFLRFLMFLQRGIFVFIFIFISHIKKLCIGEPFYCNQKLVRCKIRSVEPCYVNRVKLPNVKIVQKDKQ